MCLALVLATLAVYAQTLRFDFVDLDDPLYVTGQEIVQRGLTLQGVAWAFTTGHDANWVPLTRLSHMLDVEIFGLAPGGHHATNVLLHVLDTLLLLAALRCLTGELWPSAAVAALFALHPLHVESVAWIAERKDVLSTAFAFLALWAYGAWARRGNRRWLGACIAAMALGLLAKPMLVTLPCLLLLLDAWPLRRWTAAGGSLPLRALVREKLPLFALSVLSSVATLLAQRARGAMAPGESIPLADRVANAALACARYLEATFWPSGLSVHYPHPSFPGGGGQPLSAPEVLGAVALLLGISAAVVLGRRRGYLPVGWAWFLGTLVPVSGLVQVGVQSHADRYTYLPLVGIFVMLAWGAQDLLRPRSRPVRVAAGAASLALVAALAVASQRQVGVWRDTWSLYGRALALEPRNHTVRYALALALRERGRDAEALPHYELILEDRPGAARAYNGIGRVRQELGDHEAAVEAFRKALETLDAPLIRFNLGLSLEALGRREEALQELARAAEGRPRSARIRLAHARLLERSGELRAAEREYRAALRADPDSRPARAGLARIGAAEGAPDG